MNATRQFKAWLTKARKKEGLSMAGLAEKSGLSQGTIFTIEQGPTSPSLATAEKICKALGTSLEATVRVRKPKPTPTIASVAASDPAADA